MKLTLRRHTLSATHSGTPLWFCEVMLSVYSHNTAISLWSLHFTALQWYQVPANNCYTPSMSSSESASPASALLTCVGTRLSSRVTLYASAILADSGIMLSFSLLQSSRRPRRSSTVSNGQVRCGIGFDMAYEI